MSERLFMQTQTKSIKKIKWINLVFFTVTTLTAVIGCPLYLLHHRLSALDIGLFLFFTVATAMGITAGYHRLFAHTTYKANALVRFYFYFLVRPHLSNHV